MSNRLLMFFGGGKKYLLDTYPNASIGLSLRQLRGDYNGSCIRVRRLSDNAELNIGFVDGVLDTTTLLAFCAGTSGFLSIWYDQSGNNNHATQTLLANQPLISSAGSLITVNSKPAINFDGINGFLNLTNHIAVDSSNYNTFVGKRDLASRRLYALSGSIGSTGGYLFGIWTDNKYYLQAKATHYQGSNSTDTSTSQLLLTGANSAGNMSIYKNNNVVPSSQISTPISMTIRTIGFYINTGLLANCSLQEIAFYNNDQLSNRVGIETEINSFYNIY